MNWRSEHIWIKLITSSRKISNFCWACILFLGSLGFLLVGTSSYFANSFFPQGIVMCFYGIAGLFISSYLWCTISWSVGSGYDKFDRKEGIVNRRIFFPFRIRDIRSIRIEVKEGLFPCRNLTPREIEQKAAESAYFLHVPIEVF
ncbi:unnamed protein product [Victoria cruziana]